MNGDITVLEAKRYGIYSCREDVTLLSASQRMVDEDISALVVLDVQGNLAGIISHTDLLRAAQMRNDWRAQSVGSFMSRDVVTVMPTATLDEVAQLLLQHCIHRVVVVRPEKGGKRPIAVVSGGDLLYHLVKEQG